MPRSSTGQNINTQVNKDTKDTIDNQTMNILEKIVRDKGDALIALKAKLPLSSFIDELQPSSKDLYAALKRTDDKPYAGFILECKKASPSKGLIRADFDVKSICQIYDKYAAAISVLTDEKYFQGHYDYLKIVTDSVQCPVLNKDFFIDPYQVYLARYYGADAILLMLSVLDNEQYKNLADIAQQYNLAILTEVSNEEECHRAVALGAKLIGINNRNLRDLSTDINRTFDLKKHIPADRLVISESGIYTNQQVRHLAPQVDGFLVGSSVMAQKDIDLACKTLIYGPIKVCGLTTPEQANMVAQAGAQFGGLIFAEKSKRVIDFEQAKHIVSSTNQLKFVGVFVNKPNKEIVQFAKALNLSAVQLHGQESQQTLDELKTLLPETCQLWRAIAVADQHFTLPNNTDHLVLDGKHAGSGQVFDWQLLSQNGQNLKSAFLAGGLDNSNIKQALITLNQHQLFGLDINSGIESSAGVKCQEKVQEIFAHIRNY